MWLGLTVEEQLGTHMSLVMQVEQERSRCPGMELRVTHRSPGRMGRSRSSGQEQLGSHSCPESWGQQLAGCRTEQELLVLTLQSGIHHIESQEGLAVLSGAELQHHNLAGMVQNSQMMAHCSWRMVQNNLRMAHCSWRMAHCSWRMAHCSWRKVHCSWRMAHYNLRMAHCSWRMVHCSWRMAHCS